MTVKKRIVHTKEKPKPKVPRYRPGRRESGKMSGFEEKVDRSLAMRGVPYEYETEFLPYVKPPVPAKKGTYNPDFVLTTERGTKVYIEAKGQFDKKDRDKTLWVLEANPGIDLRLLFQRNNPIRKGSRTTYGSWCDKHGIKWSVSSTGFVPESWVRGDE